jgi:hypothetical protein
MKVPVPVNGSRTCTPSSFRLDLNSVFSRCSTERRIKSTISTGV